MCIRDSGWTVRSEYIHSTGKAFAKSITNFNDANAKDCNLNAKIGNKAQEMCIRDSPVR